MSDELLRVTDLRTYFGTGTASAKAVNGVTFSLNEGETLGIVGESGSGKSVTAMSIMRLIPSPPGKIVSGEIFFLGKNLLQLSEAAMRQIRGSEISMIFQDPLTALNPVFTIGNQIAEVIELHQNKTPKEARKIAVEMLKIVGIPDAEERAKQYPHQFSGGMRQRTMIAMALSCKPKLLIADEPTTALDVTVQAQILTLMKKLQKDLNTSIIMITHDLGVVAETCNFVAVMYAGRCVEYTDTITLFDKPLHPYTWGLLASQPDLDNTVKKQKLNTIKGNPPDLRSLPPGCNFAERCPYAQQICLEKEPELLELEKNHLTACHFSKECLNTREEVN